MICINKIQNFCERKKKVVHVAKANVLEGHYKKGARRDKRRASRSLFTGIMSAVQTSEPVKPRNVPGAPS